jgi:DNA-binding winged helix-turn-helix (wHTH) protein
MEKVRSSPGTVRFGVFEADLGARELRRQGIKIKLQEQPFQILHMLLGCPGQVVSWEELRQRIWREDTFVDFDHGLYSAIKKLREALGDSAENPRFIETLSKRGYRFIAPVDVDGTASASAAQEATKPSGAPQPPCTLDEAPTVELASAGLKAGATMPAASAAVRRNAVRVLATFAITALLLGGFLGVNSSRFRQWFVAGSVSPPIRSLAVLPLLNLSSDPAQEYFSDGMTDALITDLAQIGALKVISRTSSMQYKQNQKVAA